MKAWYPCSATKCALASAWCEMLEICVISKSGSTNKLLARLLRSNLLILYNSCDVGSENLVLDQLIIP